MAAHPQTSAVPAKKRFRRLTGCVPHSMASTHSTATGTNCASDKKCIFSFQGILWSWCWARYHQYVASAKFLIGLVRSADKLVSFAESSHMLSLWHTFGPCDHVGEYLTTTSTNVSALIQIQRVNVWCLHQHCWLDLVIGTQVTTKTQRCSKKPCATHHAIILMTTSSGCLPTDTSFLHLRSLPQIGQSVLVWKGQTCPQLCKTLMKPVDSIAFIASIKTSWEERRHKQSSVAIFECAPMEWACDIVCILSCGCGNIKGWPWLQERNQKLKTSHQNCFDLYFDFAHHNLEYLPIV